MFKTTRSARKYCIKGHDGFKHVKGGGILYIETIRIVSVGHSLILLMAGPKKEGSFKWSVETVF